MKAEIKCYNLKSIAALYRVDPRTLKNMLRTRGIEILPEGNIFTIKEVETIFDTLGRPEKTQNL